MAGFDFSSYVPIASLVFSLTTAGLLSLWKISQLYHALVTYIEMTKRIKEAVDKVEDAQAILNLKINSEIKEMSSALKDVQDVLIEKIISEGKKLDSIEVRNNLLWDFLIRRADAELTYKGFKHGEDKDA